MPRRQRVRSLSEVAVPLASQITPAADGLAWALPHGWSWTEELQLVTETAIAFVRLEPLPPEWGLREWTDEVYARAPFLRDFRRLGDREVSIPGVRSARLARFDWQPQGRVPGRRGLGERLPHLGDRFQWLRRPSGPEHIPGGGTTCGR